jgi:hypothetical protein
MSANISSQSRSPLLGRAKGLHLDHVSPSRSGSALISTGRRKRSRRRRDVFNSRRPSPSCLLYATDVLTVAERPISRPSHAARLHHSSLREQSLIMVTTCRSPRPPATRSIACSYRRACESVRWVSCQGRNSTAPIIQYVCVKWSRMLGVAQRALER